MDHFTAWARTTTANRLGWVTKAGQRWLAVIGFLSTVAGVVVFAISERRPWAWLAIAGLATLVVAVGWTAHDEHKARVAAEAAPSGPSPEWLQAEARRLLGAKAQRGYQMATLTDFMTANHHWEPWQSETFDLLRAMFGVQMALDFAAAGPKVNVPISGWAEAQAHWLDALLSSDNLPLLSDWQPKQ